MQKCPPLVRTARPLRLCQLGGKRRLCALQLGLQCLLTPHCLFLDRSHQLGFQLQGISGNGAGSFWLLAVVLEAGSSRSQP